MDTNYINIFNPYVLKIQLKPLVKALVISPRKLPALHTPPQSYLLPPLYCSQNPELSPDGLNQNPDPAICSLGCIT